jgi:hypothetical protein
MKVLLYTVFKDLTIAGFVAFALMILRSLRALLLADRCARW